LPEALARADYDYSISEEPPRRRPRQRSAERLEPMVSQVPQMRGNPRAAAPSRLGSVAGAMVRRPLRTLVCIAGGAIVFSFMANLLFMQKAPHPAPLFAKTEARQDQRPAARPEPAPAQRAAAPQTQASTQASSPASAQAPAQPASAASRSAPPSIVPAPPARPAEAQKPAAKQPEFDPIAQFLRSGSTSSGAPVSTASTGPAAIPDARRVSAAQRALMKLGHKIEADGRMGPGTRAAIQKFERDARIPVTGELNPRTVSALAARASIQIP
jgi:hypothetical protein